MKKKKLISSIVTFVHIVLVIIGGWLYSLNPLRKIFPFPFDTLYDSSGKLAKSYPLGLILFCTLMISMLLFWKDEIKRAIFIILVTLILIALYFIV